MPDSERGPAKSRGLLESLRELAASAIALVHTRLELLATELEEERLRLMRLLAWGCVAVFFLSLGAVMLTLFVVAAFWETHRLLVLGAAAGLYLAAGIAAALALRNAARARSRLFSATLAELEHDRKDLSGR